MRKALFVFLLPVVGLLAGCGGANLTGSATAPTASGASASMQTMVKSTSPGLIAAPPMAQTRIGSPAEMTARTPQGTIQAPSWTQLPGGAVNIAASPDGSLWAVSGVYGGPGGNTLWHYVNGSWTQISGAAIRLAVAPDGTLWAITVSGGIYYLRNGVWSTLAGGATDISIGADGSVYVVSGASGGPGGYTIWHNVNGTWTQLPGAGVHIAASWETSTYPNNVVPGGFYVTTLQGQIFYYSPASGTYTLQNGAGVQVAPTNGGGLFVVGYDSLANHTIWYEDLSTDQYTQEPGFAVDLTVANGTVYALANNGGIWAAPVIATQSQTGGPGSCTLPAGKQLELFSAGYAHTYIATTGGAPSGYTVYLTSAVNSNASALPAPGPFSNPQVLSSWSVYGNGTVPPTYGYVIQPTPLAVFAGATYYNAPLSTVLGTTYAAYYTTSANLLNPTCNAVLLGSWEANTINPLSVSRF